MSKNVNSQEIFVLRDLQDYDKAVEETGYGRFHYELLAVSAMSILCMGFQNVLPSYILSAACDLHLTSNDEGMLNITFMIGGIISCFLWGTLADNMGRRKVLYMTHMADALITLVCAVLPTATNLFICRFFNGILIGAPGSIIFTYVAEFQPPKYRSPVVCSCGIFFTLSWLILPLMAYFILPLTQVTCNLGNIIHMSPWRLFLVIVALPELFTALWIMKMPETPKFLLAKGYTEKCLRVLETMYSKNTGMEVDSYPVRHLVEQKVESENKKAEYDGKVLRVLKAMAYQMKSLFQPPLLVVTVLTCSIMFANMFGMFGLGLWLPKIFKRILQFEMLFPNQTFSINQLVDVQVETSKSCDGTFDIADTLNNVIIATSSLVFNIMCGFLATKLHFKVIPLVTMLLGGATSISFYFLTNSLQILVVSCLFQASMITANMTIGSIAVELFPTSVVGIALCLIMCAGRFGALASNAIFAAFMDTHVEIAVFAVGAVVLLGGLLGFLVPRKSKEFRARSLSINHGVEVSVLSSYDNKVCCH
ncbi:synaptic vesicle glycoprotein 2B-like [Anthonomus grandis grandis]|uniref:synaptic vesicle glycoprotein 2B-like n=1 Tax=Anthonomus grandis grandis TaxID=2921223 RepID=UPI0021668DA6|nr:synaptic vesicle glycoprotein 2B-like [Anthonomus grandis grandis]